MEEAFSSCDVIIEGEYQTQYRTCLQPEAGVAFLDDEGRITVVVDGQWTHEDQNKSRIRLVFQTKKVRVIYPAISVPLVVEKTCRTDHPAGSHAITRKRHQPTCKIVWSREESILGHAKRHAYTMKANGVCWNKILAVPNLGEWRAIHTSTKVLGNATLLAVGPYDIPNVATDAYAVYTNDIPEVLSVVLVVRKPYLWQKRRWISSRMC